MGNLEREAIELAHVWPTTYPSMEAGRETTCCFWFIGLQLKAPVTRTTEDGVAQQQATQNLDLTTPIRSVEHILFE